MGTRGGGAALLFAALAIGAGEDPSPDAVIQKRIESLYAKSAGLKVDGRRGDWEGIPRFEDRDAKPFPDAGLDIRRAAIAPRGDFLFVLIETVGPPSRAGLAFGIDVDFTGRSAKDMRLEFGANRIVAGTLYGEGESPRRGGVRGSVVEFGEVVEVCIALGEVAPYLSATTAREWAAGVRRSHVRVQTWTAVKGVEGYADVGPAPASFRLVASPVPLDPPLRADGEPRRAVPLPLEGTWFVRQGDHGLWTHSDLWAYDLAVEDHALAPTSVPGSRKLEDYYAFGRPIVAPEKGTVVFDSVKSPDRSPLEAATGKDTGNTLVIRLEDGLRLSFGHLQAESIAFARGEAFPPGEVLGRVGNSGDSGAPHLHLSLHEKPGEFTGLPLAFKDVRVGLNPGADDPWARDLPTWAVREGWFVTPR